MTRKRQSSRVFSKLTRALAILVVLILVSDCWPQVVRSQSDDVDTSTRHGRKKHRKQHRLKTTTPGPAPAVDITTPAMSLDDKKLLVNGEMSPDELDGANTTAEGAPKHHFPSPFIHSKEKLNKTHANMFKQ